MADWTSFARRFVALQKTEELSAARESCPDPGVLQVLHHPDILTGFIPEADWEPLATRLVADNREQEAAIVEMLATWGIATRHVVIHQDEEHQLALSLCNRLAVLSERFGFPECEAFFASALAEIHDARSDFESAASLSCTSLNLLYDLVEGGDTAFLPELSRLYVNAGKCYRDLGDLKKARDCLWSAVRTRIILARKDRATHLPSLAGAIAMLGYITASGGTYSPGRSWLSRAVRMLSSLSDDDHSVRATLAHWLNLLGQIEGMHRQFDAANDAFSRSVVLYRSLDLNQAQPHSG